MDPITLAATIVGTFLVPFCREGARRLGEALSGETNSTTADQVVATAGTIWERVNSVFTDPDDRSALRLFERSPEKFRHAVEATLLERLEADEQLRSELESLVTLRTPDGASTGAQIMNAHNAVIMDFRQAEISGGKIVGINVGAEYTAKPKTGPSGRPPVGEA